MATFYDDFERANGAPGNGWTFLNGTVTIAGGTLVSNIAFANGYNSNVSSTGRLEARCHVAFTANASPRAGPIVKMATSGYTGFCLAVSGTSNPYTIAILDGQVGGTVLASASLALNPPPFFELKLVYENGHLDGYYNGTLYVQLDTSAYVSNTLAGVSMYWTDAPILDFVAIGGSVPALTVSPSPIGNYGSPVSLTFTGSNTAWTPGTPGSPTFTVDHGTLSSQVVASATSATATYDPGLFLGTATFTDPSTGAICQVTVTSNPNTVPVGSQCPFNDDFIDLANSTADHYTGDLLRQGTYVRGGGESSTPLRIDDATIQIWDALYPQLRRPELPDTVSDGNIDVLRWLSGGWSIGDGVYSAPTAIPLAHQIQSILTALDVLITSNFYTLGDVITNITGLGVPTIHDVLDALGNLDLSAITDKLDSIQGAGGVSLATLAAALSDLRGTGSPSLHDILDAIGEISPGGSVDLSAITNKLDLIQPSTAYSLTTLASQGSGLITSVGDLSDVLTFITSDGEISLATLKLVLDAIQELLESLKVQVPPVWIGGDGETLGTPVSLVDQLVVDGPMDGVLIDVTTPPQRLGRYVVGGETLDYGVGRVTFAQEDGYCEMWQYLSFRKAIYVPKTMAVATSAHFQVVGGAEGTVTPFIRS